MKTWKKCGHVRDEANTCAVSARLPGGRCRTCQLAAQARYNKTEKRRRSVARYAKTEKGLLVQARYNKTEKGRFGKATHEWRRLGVAGNQYANWFVYWSYVLAQKGGCALCDLPARSGKRFDLEHAHDDGVIRGAVHGSGGGINCNQLIGMYEAGRLKNPARIAQVERYLMTLVTRARRAQKLLRMALREEAA